MSTVPVRARTFNVVPELTLLRTSLRQFSDAFAWLFGSRSVATAFPNEGKPERAGAVVELQTSTGETIRVRVEAKGKVYELTGVISYEELTVVRLISNRPLRAVTETQLRPSDDVPHDHEIPGGPFSLLWNFRDDLEVVFLTHNTDSLGRKRIKLETLETITEKNTDFAVYLYYKPGSTNGSKVLRFISLRVVRVEQNPPKMVYENLWLNSVDGVFEPIDAEEPDFNRYPEYIWIAELFKQDGEKLSMRLKNNSEPGFVLAATDEDDGTWLSLRLDPNDTSSDLITIPNVGPL